MATLEIVQVPVLSDNYVYLVHDPDSGETAAVDPAVARPVLDAAARCGWRITHILNTHHHGDHTGGNQEIKRATGCTIVGNRHDAARIPGLDVGVAEGETVRLGDQEARVFEVPGHTVGHVAYWFADAAALFCGDTLFSIGCGRMFEGTAPQMLASLDALASLAEETRVHCAHEYTRANCAFATHVDPDNPDLARRCAEVERLRGRGERTVPSQLADELRCNPFLRTRERAVIASAVERDPDCDGSPEAVFAVLRSWKDAF